MSWRPYRDIELIAGTPPGGGQDRPARALAVALDAHGLLDVPLKLLNIPGRGGGNAWNHLARHPGNPHLLAVSAPPLITNKLLGDAAIDHADLTPLAILCTEYITFVVRADSPLRDGHDLLQSLRHPNRLTIALATAVGNTNHMALALCTQHAGGEVKALQLRVSDSALYAVAEVIEGRAEVGVVTAASAAKGIAAGKLRALALSSAQRMPRDWRDVPTWREHGVNCVIGTWRGVTGTSQLTPAEIAYWDGVLSAAARTPEWQAELERNSWMSTYLDSAAARAFMDSEKVSIQRALADLGLM